MRILLTPFVKAFRVYSICLERRPLLTQSLTSGVLMSCGDAMSQIVIEKRDIFDFTRTGQFFALGTCFYGPILRGWYMTLSKIIKGTPKVAAVKMVLLDQTLMPPIFIGSFLVLFGLLRGQSVDEIKEKINTDAPEMLLNNYKVWPLVQIVNFYFVPLNYRVLVVNGVAVFWNTYVSYIGNRQSLKQMI